MQKRLLIASVAIAMGLCSGAASAADIQNLSGQSCGSLIGTWHFINNQTGTTTPGFLQATWSSGDTCGVTAGKVLKGGTQHFYCTASGTLTSAFTNLNGNLVLSDFSCDQKCTPDPKTGECPTPPK